MTALQKVDQLPAQSADNVTMISVISRAASDPSVDIEKLERLMAMKERMDAKDAETAFNDAMSDAQARIRPISADLTNPQTRSKYASYAKLNGKLRPIYTDSGFSLSFDTDDSPKEDHVRVLCYVSHKSGHTRTYKADMPVDGKGAKGNDVMTKTHAFGSGTSYGMRYLLKMIFNVAVGEDDDDGNGAAMQITEAQHLKADEFLQAIAEAETVKGLVENVGKAIASAGLPGQLLRSVRSTYTARLNVLRNAESD